MAILKAASSRLAAIIFLAHAIVTVVLGYVLLPRFESGLEPPPGPPSYASFVVATVRVFYFPVLWWAQEALVTGLSRPGPLFVVLNSALATVCIMAIGQLLMSARGAVA